jgi:hypothetical protein
MSAPLVPSPLDYVGLRKFLLYPPISNISPNEWLRGKSSWSGAQFVNAITGQDVWVPWRSICGVSDRPGLQLVVELKDELEYRDGAVSPRVKCVIPLPVTHQDKTPVKRKRGRRKGPAAVVGIRIEPEPATAPHWIAKTLLILLALFLLATLVFRLVKI